MTVAVPGASAEVPPKHLLVAVSGSSRSLELVRYASDLAAIFGCSWEALHVVTTKSVAAAGGAYEAADALSLAAELGASVARVPAPSAADGICSHLESSPASDLVLGASRPRGLVPWPVRSTAFALVSRQIPTRMHLLAASAEVDAVEREHARSAPAIRRRRDYLQVAGATIATALVALLLRPWLSPGALGLLFLLPVIAASARSGSRLGLFAVLLSVIFSNWLLIEPRFAFSFSAAQTWVLAVVLVPIAIYTGSVTSELRRRVTLSDRSAQENANIAAFAQQLTRVADWNATAELVCVETAKLLGGLQTVLFREIDGELAPAAAQPGDPRLSPVDYAALNWVWIEGVAAGSGTTTLGDANWQFHPLRTSLGTLAVLGLAREDGRNPVRADQAVLLSTLLAQAALAHERLRLEDLSRGPGAG